MKPHDTAPYICSTKAGVEHDYQSISMPMFAIELNCEGCGARLIALKENYEYAKHKVEDMGVHLSPLCYKCFEKFMSENIEDIGEVELEEFPDTREKIKKHHQQEREKH